MKLFPVIFIGTQQCENTATCVRISYIQNARLHGYVCTISNYTKREIRVFFLLMFCVIFNDNNKHAQKQTIAGIDVIGKNTNALNYNY